MKFERHVRSIHAKARQLQAEKHVEINDWLKWDGYPRVDKRKRAFHS